MKRQVTSLPHQEAFVGRPWNPTTKKGNYDTSRNPLKNIIIHSMDGTLAGSVAWFRNLNVNSSAHYGIGLDGKIVALIPEDATAYQAGLYSVNQESIGIEHEDLGNNQMVRSDALYESSARLVADICKFYGLKCDRNTVKLHREIKATACPGNLDVDRIIRRANELLSPFQDEALVSHMLKPSVFAALVAKSTEYDLLWEALSLDPSLKSRMNSHEFVLQYFLDKLAEAKSQFSSPTPAVAVTPQESGSPLTQPKSVWKKDVSEMLSSILSILKREK